MTSTSTQLSRSSCRMPTQATMNTRCQARNQMMRKSAWTACTILRASSSEVGSVYCSSTTICTHSRGRRRPTTMIRTVRVARVIDALRPAHWMKAVVAISKTPIHRSSSTIASCVIRDVTAHRTTSSSFPKISNRTDGGSVQKSSTTAARLRSVVRVASLRNEGAQNAPTRNS